MPISDFWWLSNIEATGRDMSDDNMETPKRDSILIRRREKDSRFSILNLREELKQMILDLKADLDEKLDTIKQDINESNRKILRYYRSPKDCRANEQRLRRDSWKIWRECKTSRCSKKKIQRLEDKIEDLLHLKRLKVVEIKNIPIKGGEDLEDPVKKLCEVVDIAIRSVHRINRNYTSTVITKFFHADDKR